MHRDILVRERLIFLLRFFFLNEYFFFRKSVSEFGPTLVLDISPRGVAILTPSYCEITCILSSLPYTPFLLPSSLTIHAQPPPLLSSFSFFFHPKLQISLLSIAFFGIFTHLISFYFYIQQNYDFLMFSI